MVQLKRHSGMNFVRLIPLLAALLLSARFALAAEVREVTDLHGVKHRLPAEPGQKATALIFITHDCPIANGYAPEINRIVAEYAAKKISLYVVYVDPDLSTAAALKHAADFGYQCPAILDPAHELVALAKVTVTPEAAVFSPEGREVYRGRIDDVFPDYGQRKEQPTQRDLRAALDAVLAGKAVPNPVTKPVGCYISDVKK